MVKEVLCVTGFLAGSLGFFSIAGAEVQPAEGPPGISVTVRGGEFGRFQGNHVNRVEFNGIQALIQLWERDVMMVKVPFDAAPGPLTVHIGSQSLDMGTFLVQQPTITRVLPSEAEPEATS